MEIFLQEEAGREGGRAADSLVEQRADDGAAARVGLVHQGVQIGQEGVADVEHFPGNFLKSRIPSDGILPLKKRGRAKLIE